MPLLDLIENISTALWSHLPSPIVMRVLVVGPVWVASFAAMGAAMAWLDKRPTRALACLLTVAGLLAVAAVAYLAAGNGHTATA
jgi:CHASE2 domain-containing sensor protein